MKEFEIKLYDELYKPEKWDLINYGFLDEEGEKRIIEEYQLRSFHKALSLNHKEKDVRFELLQCSRMINAGTPYCRIEICNEVFCYVLNKEFNIKGKIRDRVHLIFIKGYIDVRKPQPLLFEQEKELQSL